MLDLNKFKGANDKYGHHKEDEFLVLVDNMQENTTDNYVKELQSAIRCKTPKTFE